MAGRANANANFHRRERRVRVVRVSEAISGVGNDRLVRVCHDAAKLSRVFFRTAFKQVGTPLAALATRVPTNGAFFPGAGAWTRREENFNLRSSVFQMKNSLPIRPKTSKPGSAEWRSSRYHDSDRYHRQQK